MKTNKSPGSSPHTDSPTAAQPPSAAQLPPGAHTDFSGEMSYADYLGLDTLLAAQNPRSGDHNEMLFIVQHQTTELWIRLMLHELGAARAHIRGDDLPPAFKMLARVARITDNLIQAWDILATLTPSEYTAFRSSLGKSSGFQSHQYRLLEFLLGNKNVAMLAPFAHRPDIHAALQAMLAAPSLYDEAIRLLARRGFAIAPQCIERDWAGAYRAHDSVAAAWCEVYVQVNAKPAAHWDLYELAEKLVDLEDHFRQWRFRHMTTVERIIGFKRGTGGTAGAAYLKGLLDLRLFPELWDVRTSL